MFFVSVSAAIFSSRSKVKAANMSKSLFCLNSIANRPIYFKESAKCSSMVALLTRCMLKVEQTKFKSKSFFGHNSNHHEDSLCKCSIYNSFFFFFSYACHES